MDEVEGRKLETIESLAQGERLHPVQAAFVQAGAMQCGYCVPGMVMATVGLLRTTATPTDAQILEGLNGNLCRCCGYLNILNAVRLAARKAKETQ
jgi:carbon-monoxide dehydrogenase small subunit